MQSSSPGQSPAARLSKVLTEAEFRHGLLDPHVSKQRVKLYGRGVYVDATELERALRERDVDLEVGELDRHVARIGGHRVQRGRVLHALGLRERRRPQYYLPELSYQRIRQGARGGTRYRLPAGDGR